MQIIPDTINLAIFLLSLFNIISKKSYLYNSLTDLILGILLNILITLVVIYYLVIKKVEILGFGDIKLFFAIGIYLGCIRFVIALFVSSFIALACEIIFFKLKRKEVPFGPYLSLGFLIVIIFNQLLENSLLFQFF